MGTKSPRRLVVLLALTLALTTPCVSGQDEDALADSDDGRPAHVAVTLLVIAAGGLLAIAIPLLIAFGRAGGLSGDLRQMRRRYLERCRQNRGHPHSSP